jgi:tape measure domain-containing protein
MKATAINLIIGADIAQFESAMSKLQKATKKIGKQFTDIGKSMTIGLTVPLVGLGIAAIKSASEIDTLKRALKAVMGSTERAEAEFKKLIEVAKLPGLGLEDAVRGSVNLQAAGFSADQARRALLAFGNALATVGKGKDDLAGVNLVLTQILNKPKVMQQDLNQLFERLPQVRGAMLKTFGTFSSEGLQAMGIDGVEFVEKIITEFEKLPKMTGGLKNAFENMGDSIQISLAKLGLSINKTFDIEGLINNVSDFIAKLVSAFDNLSPAAQKTILVMAGLVTVMGPLMYLFGTLLTSITPVGLAIFGIVTAITALTGVVTYFTGANKDLSNGLRDQEKSIASAKSAFNAEMSVLKAGNISQEERKRLITGINEKYSEFMPRLITEKDTISDINQLQKESNTIFLKKLMLKSQEAALTEKLNKIIELEKKNASTEISMTNALIKSRQKLLETGKGTRGASQFANAQRAIDERKKEIEQIQLSINKEDELYKTISERLGIISSVAEKEKEIASIRNIDSKQTTKKKDYQIGDFFGGGMSFGGNDDFSIGDMGGGMSSVGDGYKIAESKLKESLAKRMLSQEEFNAKMLELQVAQINAELMLHNEDTLVYQELLTQKAELENNYELQSLAMIEKVEEAKRAARQKTFNDTISGLLDLSGAMQEFGMKSKGLALFEIAANTAMGISRAVAAGAGLIFPANIGAIASGVASVVSGGAKAKQAFSGAKFADGGIVSGPTVGMVGEYAGARNNPEVISPLNKLKKLIGDNGGNQLVQVVGSVRVQGQDLLIAIENANKVKMRMA